MNMRDDDFLVDAFARRRLTMSDERSLDGARDFIARHDFAAAGGRRRLAVELLVAAAVAAIAAGLIVALARHALPTSSLSSRPHAQTPAPIIAKPTPTITAPPTAAPDGTCLAQMPMQGSRALLAGVQAVSSTHLWVVGDLRILSSHDAGRTWQVEYNAQEQLVGVDAIDDSHAWAVGVDTLLATSDGGRHWASVGEPSTPLIAVHFVGPLEGFGIAGTSCTLVKTYDGGHTWQLVRSAPGSASSVCFVDSQRGWLGAKGLVFQTLDGGNTWAPRLDTRNGTISSDILTLECAAPAGVAVEAWGGGGAAGSSPNAAWTSTDGVHFVQTWVAGMWPVVDNTPPGPGSYPGPFSIVDSQRTAWIGNTPAMYPYNAGLVESAKSVATKATAITCSGDVVGAAFITSQRGWVLCDSYESTPASYAILFTSDGGATWTMQYTTSE